jgi:uncharacterized pyridoxamine 5'-phosphate oxidase family protein
MTATNEVLKVQVRDFLHAHRKAVFAILDKNGLPTTSLMLYAVDDNFNVYFGTRRAFTKYQEMLQNPVVSLSVIEESVDPLKVVDMRGIVTEISENDRNDVFTFFKSKNPSRYYVEAAEDFVMFKLTPNFMRWLDAESGELKIVDLVL